MVTISELKAELPGHGIPYMSAEAPGGEFVDTNILIYAFDRSAGKSIVRRLNW